MSRRIAFAFFSFFLAGSVLAQSAFPSKPAILCGFSRRIDEAVLATPRTE